jgi:hypothetical protein
MFLVHPTLSEAAIGFVGDTLAAIIAEASA